MNTQQEQENQQVVPAKKLTPAEKKEAAAKKRLIQSVSKKTTMNFAIPVSTKNRLSVVLPVAVAVVIFIALFTKFAVLDRWQKLSEKEQEVAVIQAQVDEYNVKLKDYDTISERYYRYTTYFMTDQENSLMDRIDLLDFLTKSCGTTITVDSVSISYNNVSFSAKAADLETIRDFADTMEKDKNVVSVTVHSVSKTTATTGDYVTASITMVVTGIVEEETEEAEKK